MNKYKQKTPYMYKYNRTNIGHFNYIYRNVRLYKCPQLSWDEQRVGKRL
nr:MAG TPA: capping enzyme small subunit [Caudoviricetes sp.]